MKTILPHELENYKMVIPPTNNAQQFPTTLRFYYKSNKSYPAKYYTFNSNVSITDDPNINPDSFAYTKEFYDRTLNGELTQEQKYMISQIKYNTKGIIHMGTGKWKSRVIYAATCLLGNSTLILTHNIQTAKDMYEWFLRNTNISQELIACTYNNSKHPFTPETKVHIMTHASFKKKRKDMYKAGQRYNSIFYDECDFHLSFPKGQDYDCMVSALIISEQQRLYWLTWTPYRAEWGTEALLRVYKNIRSFNPDQLIQSDFSVADQNILDGQKSQLPTNGNKYHYIPTIYQVNYYSEEDYIIENRHELVKELVDDDLRKASQLSLFNNHNRKRNLILVKSVQESYNLFYELCEEYPNVVLLNWDLNQKQEKENLNFIQKCIDNNEWFIIVWTIDKIGRGVDIPPIDTLFLFSPVKFQWTVVQAVGRALRKYPWKEDVIIYDRCDLPILRKQKRQREQAYMSEYSTRAHEIRLN